MEYFRKFIFFSILSISSSQFDECVNRAIENLFTEDETVIVLPSADTEYLFLNEVQNQRIIFSIEELAKFNRTVYFKMGVVLFLNVDDDIFKILHIILNSKLYQTNADASDKWLAITPTKYIAKYFFAFWGYEIINVVVLAYFFDDIDNFNLELITSDPQAIPNSCGQSVKVIQQQSCNSKIAFEFPKIRRKYNDCNITLCSGYPIAQKPQTELLVSVFLMNITTTHLKGNLKIDYSDRCSHEFRVINMFLRVNSLIKNSVVFYTSKPIWIVPKPKKISPIESITLFFKKTVWVLILISIFITTTIWWLIVKQTQNKNEFFVILLQIWRATLFGSTNEVPSQWSLRFIFISYIIYCIHIQAVFNSKIVEILTVPHYEHGIRNLNDLSESNLSILIARSQMNILFDTVTQDRLHNNLYKKLKRVSSTKIVQTFIDCVVKESGCAAFFVGDEDYLSDYLNETILNISHLIRDSAVIGSLNYVFMTKNHAYLSPTINDVISTLVESGICDYYIKTIEIENSMRMSNVSNTCSQVVLTIDHLYSNFAFLAVEIEDRSNGKLEECIDRATQKLFTEEETLVVLSSVSNNYIFPSRIPNQRIFFSSERLKRLHYSHNFKIGVIIYVVTEDEIGNTTYIWLTSKLHMANSNPSVKYLVITTRDYVKEIFLLFWKHEILHLVVLTYDNNNNNSTLELFTSSPQSPSNNCGHDLKFDRRKYTNCNFTVCSMHSVAQQAQNEMLISEFLMKITINHLHANANFQVAENCSQELYVGHMFLRLHLHIENSAIYYMSKPIWAVPKAKKITLMKAATLIFKQIVWISILLSFFLAAVYWWLVAKYKNDNSDFLLILLDIWGITLFGSINKIPLRWSLRFVFIAYVVYCIHIQSVIASKVIEILTVPHYEHGIQNLEDLSESNISILIRSGVKKILFNELNLKQHNVYNNLFNLMQNTKKTEIIDKFYDCVSKEPGCAAFFLEDETYLNDTILEVSHLIRNNSATGSTNYVFVMLKHKYLSLTINKIIYALVESGISGHFVENLKIQYVSTVSSNSDSQIVLTVEHLYICFIFCILLIKVKCLIKVEQHVNSDLHACVNRVVENLFEEDETLVVLSSESNDYTSLIGLTRQRIFLSIEELEDWKQSNYFKMGIIWFFDLNTNVNTLRTWCLSRLHEANSNPSVKWFVIAHRHNNISEYFLFFWKYEFLNVVVLVHYTENNETYFQLITSDPQDTLNNCGRNFISANYQSCHSNNAVKLTNFERKYNNCTFRVCSAYPITTQKQTELVVTESIIKIVATFLNANFEFVTVNSCSPSFKIMNSFLRRQNFYSQNSVIFYSSKPVWAVPKPKKISPFKAITLIFKNTVWVLILMSFVITSIFLRLLTRLKDIEHEFQLTLLEMWQITLFGYMNKIPPQWTFRFVLIFYVIYCIHIQAVITSKIVELITIPQYEHGIQNVKELSESDLTILVSHGVKFFIFDRFDLEHDHVSNKIKKLLESTSTEDIVDTFLHCLATDSGCAAFFVGDEDYLNDTISEVAHLFRDNSVVGSTNYVLCTLKHSYVFEIINQIMYTVVESGISDYYIKKLESQNVETVSSNTTKTILTMSHLYIVFVFLAVGLLLSVIVFIGEMLLIRK
ncbi:hypothetical protein FQR65_LT04274 [Abscondita terminalis]|nr:hypothetical protein FQR65_LT04274 [Abscondita terminalis]